MILPSLVFPAPLKEWQHEVLCGVRLCLPPVWLVWNQLYEKWQFLFLFAKQTNWKPVKKEVNSTVILPLLVLPKWGVPCHNNDQVILSHLFKLTRPPPPLFHAFDRKSCFLRVNLESLKDPLQNQIKLTIKVFRLFILFKRWDRYRELKINN